MMFQAREHLPGAVNETLLLTKTLENKGEVPQMCLHLVRLGVFPSNHEKLGLPLTRQPQ